MECVKVTLNVSICFKTENNIQMAPQELVAALLKMEDKQGQQLLKTQLPAIDDTSLNLLVELIKREADRQWAKESGLSFRLAGYLMFIGDTIQNKYVHALGLMARGDALRRMDRDQAALPFFDAAGAEFLEIDDEVSWRALVLVESAPACN